MTKTGARTRVFITMATQGIAKSTDRGYLYGQLPRMAARYPVEFLKNDRVLTRLDADYRFLRGRLQSALAPRLPTREYLYALVQFPAELDVVYAYGQFPRVFPGLMPPRDVPIVWQQTFAPITLGVDVRAWGKAMRRSRTAAMRRANRIVVPSEVSLEHVYDLFPFARDKVELLPYYLPDVEPLGAPELAAKFDAGGKMRLLFVGKQARRKGLPELVKAWEYLTPETRALLDVTVVSAFVDGVVALPEGWHHETFVKDLYAAMGEAHVFAFPTRAEAYGLVLVEAMGRGAAILTTSNPLQRGIVGEAGGAFADPDDAAALARALTDIVHDRARTRAMAQANVARFREHYWHEVVGPAHLDVFERTRRGRSSEIRSRSA